MKRANVYALLFVIAVFLLFCLAAVSANAQETANDESIVIGLGELIDGLVARVDALDERWNGCAFRGSSGWMAAEGQGVCQRGRPGPRRPPPRQDRYASKPSFRSSFNYWELRQAGSNTKVVRKVLLASV